jgi:hypothetical protein
MAIYTMLRHVALLYKRSCCGLLLLYAPMSPRLTNTGDKQMSVKVKYDSGEITFNLVDVLEYIPKEQLAAHVEALSCNEQILAHVAEQIATGYTEYGYFGSRFCTPEPDENSGTALDKAIRRVAKASGDVARKEIERLESALKLTEKSRDDYMSKYHDLVNKDRRFA